MGHKKLTAKQDGFAYDIANKKYDFQWEAYEANYNVKGMTRNSIYVEACKLIQNPKVALRIKEIEDKIKAKEKVTLDEILIKLSQRVNLDIREMFDENDCLIPIKEMTQEQAIFIESFDTNELWGWEDDESGKKQRTQIGVIKKVKIESIRSIMDMLIKYYGGYAKDNEQKSSNLDAIREIVQGSKGK